MGLSALALALGTGCGGDDVPVACSGSSAFTLQAKYTAIKSYPGGGGLFIVRLSPAAAEFSEEAQLELSAQQELHARSTRTVLSRQSDTAEVTIQPSTTLSPGEYRIDVVARTASCTRTLPLDVKLVPWDAGTDSEAPRRRDEFLAWLNAAHPELGPFSSSGWSSFLTYPGILIVEHWTFLNERWEMRVCFHVMLPPDDWSMMRLRAREAWDPILAARRDSDGTSYAIPLDRYPMLEGY